MATSEIGRLLGMGADYRTFKPDSRFVLPDCRIGVECEFENVRRNLPVENELRYWTPHAENSLRNNGQEWVFAEPLFGADAYKAIEWLFAQAKRAGFVTSVRTGLHVHVDARDLDYTQFTRMCLAYALVEPVLFDWVGDQREESIYCVPWYYADRSVDAAVRIIKAMASDSKKDVESIRAQATIRRGVPRELEIRAETTTTTSQASQNYERYAAFNLNSLHKFGSIEARHMLMTLDQQRVFDWINMLMCLKKFAMTNNYDPIAMLKDVGNRGFIEALFGPLSPKLINGKLHEHMARGLMTALDIRRQTKTEASWEGFVNAPIKNRTDKPSPGISKFIAKHTAKRTPHDAPQGNTVIFDEVAPINYEAALVGLRDRVGQGLDRAIQQQAFANQRAAIAAHQPRIATTALNTPQYTWNVETETWGEVTPTPAPRR